MGESHIDHRLAGILGGIEGATLHFRTSNPVNHVKLVVRQSDPDDARATVDRVDAELRKRIGPGHLRRRRRDLPGRGIEGAARSRGDAWPLPSRARAGLAGQLITSESGASSFFRGSIVTYSDEMKTSVLGVKAETIADFGAVSEPTAREMAEGAKRVCNSSVAVSITGRGGARGRRSRQAGGHRLLRGLRTGDDAHLDEAVRG